MCLHKEVLEHKLGLKKARLKKEVILGKRTCVCGFFDICKKQILASDVEKNHFLRMFLFEVDLEQL